MVTWTVQPPGGEVYTTDAAEEAATITLPELDQMRALRGDLADTDSGAALVAYGSGTVADKLDDLIGSTDAASAGKLRADLASDLGGALVAIEQAGTGGQRLTLAEILGDMRISPRRFGAALDGSTDDTAALQAYADHLATLADSSVSSGQGLAKYRRPTFWIPPGDGAVISDQLAISKNISVVMEAPIWVDAAADAADVWVDIGASSTANTQSRNVEIVVDVRRLTQSDWSDAGDIGVRISAAAANIWLRRADKFYTGAEICAPYGNLILGEFRDNKFSVDISATAIDFTNQLTALGGEFACATGVNSGKDRYGIRVRRGSFASKQNSFRFIGPSFELNVATASPGVAIPFYLDDVYILHATDIRTEGNSTAVATLRNDCRWCRFEVGNGREYDTPVAQLLDDQSTYKIGNKAALVGEDYDWRQALLVFDSGNFADNITFYGSSSYHIRNMESMANTDPPVFQYAAGIDAVDWKNREVDFGSPFFGVRLDTRNAKNFCVVVGGSNTKDGTLSIVAFDANGNQLTANTDVLHNASTPTVAPNTGVYGGLYSLSTDIDGYRQEAVVTFSANVATAFVGVATGKFRSMRIYALDGPATFFSKSTLVAKDARLATGAPATGFYLRGTVVKNATPSSAGAPGWVCTAGGESGTLSSVTADTTASSAVVTFSDATNLWIGAAVTITGVTGTKIIEALEGAVARVDSNCDATVSGAAVAYVAPTFKAEANLA